MKREKWEDVFKSAQGWLGYHTHTHHTHTVCWVGAYFAVLFFIRMSGKDTFPPRLPPPLPSCFTFKDDLFY